MLRVFLSIIVAGLAFRYPAYYKAIRRARDWQKKFNSKRVYTPFGIVEYAVSGKGVPVLVVHGAAGGYDQGILSVRGMLGENVQVIAPSRFGYQNTILPKIASPEVQADAYAVLLEALKIDKVFVIGISAGAPSSVQFALRHPDKVQGLILLVPLGYSPVAEKPRSVAFPFILSSLLKSDYPLWVAMKLFPRQVLSTIGIPLAIQKQLSRQQKKEVMDWLLPFSTRIKGLMNDGKIAAKITAYPVQDINMACLIFSTKDDPWKTYPAASYLADNIRGAQFIGFEKGGHLLHGKEVVIKLEIAAFIDGHYHKSLAEPPSVKWLGIGKEIRNLGSGIREAAGEIR